jgi:hypothetical protein
MTIIKRKSLIVALVSSWIICGSLVLTLIGYAAYLEWKDSDLKSAYGVLLEKINARIYSRHIAVSGLAAAIAPSGPLKGKAVLEGRLANTGYREVDDLLLRVKFLDKDGAMIYEVVFHPQEPSLGYPGLSQVPLPYIYSPPKTSIKRGSTMPFKKILYNCPKEIFSGIGSSGAVNRWPGKLESEILSVSFQAPERPE